MRADFTWSFAVREVEQYLGGIGGMESIFPPTCDMGKCFKLLLTGNGLNNVFRVSRVVCMCFFW